jgi:hypothetical protein
LIFKIFQRLLALLALLASPILVAGTPPAFEISGVYPHLAYFNQESECGTGAVVPWADRLWVITYAPHKPKGSTDKLYEITPDLQAIIRPESIGGTPANRFIHRESQQLFIGPYVIDRQRRVRVIPYEQMYGRPTGTARHLVDPENRVYYASMEEGFYEVDVRTLAVTELFRDEQLPGGRKADLPGYHGKGLFSGQGRLIYANNGEHGPAALRQPEIPSGSLSSWDGVASQWTAVRRNQFTEVTGPGGLTGNEHPATDPVWSIGWDYRSLILMVLDGGKWSAYRLPKSSHAYDGAHGWNTEWPRIREIGEPDLLMTMHGAFWRFPANFGVAHSAGVVPRSNYLKVIGDFTRWGDRLVMGCDDTAQSEFLNKRRAKGQLAAPGQSQSNLWFIEPAQLDRLGPALGRGAVWINEPAPAKVASDPFLFSGFDERLLHLAHDAGVAVTFTLEVDRAGDNRWAELRQVVVPATGYAWTAFSAEEKGAWVRIKSSQGLRQATASFAMRNVDRRPVQSEPRFAGLAENAVKAASGGLLHARGDDKKTLGFAATRLVAGKTEAAGFYEMGPAMTLRLSAEPGAAAWMEAHVAIPREAVTLDAASVVYTDEAGVRFRLPKARRDYVANGPFGAERAVREVATERDILHCAGTFFELPAENAGGIAKVRPIASHEWRIHDYASWRGLLVMSGIAAEAPAHNRHIIRSEDNQVAVWVGAIDDLWRLGRPIGEGGPWQDTVIKAGEPSDPYLLTGYEKKTLWLSHAAAGPVEFKVEVDLTGTGLWVVYQTWKVPADQKIEHIFPAAYQGYWLRVTADTATSATAWLRYE